MYHTSALMLGRSYALCAAGVVSLVDVWSMINSSIGFLAKHHSLVSFFSLQPFRIGLPVGESTLTYYLVKTTVQSESHIGPTPTSVLVKEGMMYPIVWNSAANWGMVILAFDDDFFYLSICCAYTDRCSTCVGRTMWCWWIDVEVSCTWVYDAHVLLWEYMSLWRIWGRYIR